MQVCTRTSTLYSVCTVHLDDILLYYYTLSTFFLNILYITSKINVRVHTRILVHRAHLHVACVDRVLRTQRPQRTRAGGVERRDMWDGDARPGAHRETRDAQITVRGAPLIVSTCHSLRVFGISRWSNTIAQHCTRNIIVSLYYTVLYNNQYCSS